MTDTRRMWSGWSVEVRPGVLRVDRTRRPSLIFRVGAQGGGDRRGSWVGTQDGRKSREEGDDLENASHEEEREEGDDHNEAERAAEGKDSNG
jgi:hypothetical protein